MPSTPLLAPGELFTRRSPSLTSAAIIVLLAGIVAVASAAPYVDQFSSLEFSVESRGHTGTALDSVVRRRDQSLNT
jgi:hypothetical protein